ncbi:hypothetical protein OIDMADRAFT_131030 [Oidiodendron maius Zn]|uniref:Major facilitator superfamily (MFS) profile domain-containing protein n=1 Tax=Oidiodendron maius (strain Zn) TaxID=913774 RepID=A0A0C3H423_OIDMZ|nr:hypothetical protein OIDMADRAFT_131030 [Oidiodendron maius Zn]
MAEVDAASPLSRRSQEFGETNWTSVVRSTTAGVSAIPTAELDTPATTRADRDLERRLTSPRALSRIETQRLQYTQTVGGTMQSRSRASREPWPAFGAGKPYPPPLPARDQYVVEFDGPDDLLHPQNWPLSRKMGIGAVLAFTSLCSTFDSSIFSTSTNRVSEIFGVSFEVAVLSSSLYILGYAFGPLIWAPFSELKGRRVPIIVGMFGFSIFNIAVATAKDLQTVFISRFFTGVFGSCPLAVVAAVFADIFDNHMRGVAVAVFASTVFLGPLIAPFIGGFINTSYLGWRWTAYIPAIMGFTALTLNVFFLQESYPPVVLIHKAEKLRRRTRNWGIHAKQEEIELDLRELIVSNFSRPLRLLISEPLILAVTLYLSFIYGLLYCFLTAYPIVFQGVYHMSPGVGGLPFFGMVIGLCVAGAVVVFSNPSYNRKLEANNGIPVPEWRLPPVIIGGVLFAGGLFWFGWTGFTDNIPWIVPTLSGLFTGFGLLIIFIQLFNYLIDTYLIFAASAIAANTFVRSIFAASFPLFSRQLFDNLGIQWAGTLLGCFAVILIPIPIYFWFFGKRLRQKSPFAPVLDDKRPAADEIQPEPSLETGVEEEESSPDTPA